MTSNAHVNFSSRRLVIFGCGYVGGAVAAEALARGMRVTALTRNALTAESLRAAGAEVVVAELADSGWWPKIAPAEFVLNAVAAASPDPSGYRRSYVDGMESILGWSRAAAGPRTLVYTSSTSVYPQGAGARVDESSPTWSDVDPASGRDERGALLAQAEQCLLAAGAEVGRRFVLRLAGIYGPERLHLMNQVRAGTVAGSGAHRLNLAHRDDIVAAIWACFSAGPEIPGGVFNVVDDEPSPKREVAHWLAARLGLPEPAFTGQPVAGRRATVPDRVIVNERLKCQLGWAPRYRTYREGYAAVLD